MPTALDATALLASVVVLLDAGTVSAQRPDAPPLTAEHAMALARRHHPALEAASARRTIARGAARHDAAFPNPVMEWRQERTPGALQTNEFVTVSQPLDLTGRRLALRSEARFVNQRAMADSEMVARDVETTAARAYWRASLARSLLEIASELRADAERLASVDGARAREGAVAELVAMRAEVEASRARLAEATARAEWERARAAVAVATGLAIDSLPPIPSMTPVARTSLPSPSAEATYAMAVARRSDLAWYRASVEVARRRRSAENRAALADVSVQVGLMRSAGFPGRVIGVSVPLPLLDRNAGGRTRASGAVRLAEAELKVAEHALRAEVVAAVQGLSALLSSGGTGADSLAARAAEVARVATAAYGEGGVTLVELLDARRSYADAVGAALRWSAEVRLARLELNRVSGAPLTEALELP